MQFCSFAHGVGILQKEHAGCLFHTSVALHANASLSLRQGSSDRAARIFSCRMLQKERIRKVAEEQCGTSSGWTEEGSGRPSTMTDLSILSRLLFRQVW